MKYKRAHDPSFVGLRVAVKTTGLTRGRGGILTQAIDIGTPQ